MAIPLEMIAALTGIFAALAMIKCVVARVTDTPDPAISSLLVSNACLVLAVCALLMRPQLGFAGSAASVIGLTYFGIAFGFFAIADALGAERHMGAFLGFGLISTAAQGAYATTLTSAEPLMLTSSLATGGAALVMAVLTARASRGAGPMLTLFLTLSFGVVALAYFVRAGFMLLMPGSNAYQVATAVIAIAIAISAMKWIFGLVAVRRVQLAQMLDHARQRADAANEAKTAFLRSMSHELRTPLNAVIGLSALMRDEAMGPLDASYRQNAEQINRSGRHLLDLINDLIDLSAVEAGKLALDERPVDLEEVFDEVQSMVPRHPDLLGTAFDRPAITRGRWVVADRRRILQVVLNLASNAAKYGGSDVRIRLSAGLDEDGAPVIRVTDTGPGMSEDEMRTAFTLYGRVGERELGEVEGTGIGLPLSLELVEAHGGTLRLESCQGRGTTAIIRLPAERAIDLGERPAAGADAPETVRRSFGRSAPNPAE